MLKNKDFFLAFKNSYAIIYMLINVLKHKWYGPYNVQIFVQVIYSLAAICIVNMRVISTKMAQQTKPLYHEEETQNPNSRMTARSQLKLHSLYILIF